MKIKSIILVFLMLIAFTSAALCQLKQGESVEKIMAVVGNEIITKSDILGYLSQMAMQDPSIKIDDPELQKRVLEVMLNEKLVIAKAIEDSIVVTEDEVNQRWDYQIQRFVARYGSEKRIEDIYGMSIQQMKNDFKEDIRKQILSERMKAKAVPEVQVTPSEVKEFYNRYIDSLPILPAQIELFHIVKNVESDRQTKEDLYKLARVVRDSILAGGDFADFAKRYSGDPGSAATGGELGWAPKGRFIKEFEQAAFSQQKDAISMPVETPFGLHIIQTIDKTKDSLKTKHILFKFGQNQEDIEKAKTIKEITDKLKDGDVSEPIVFAAEPKRSFHIIYRKRTIPEHKANLDDDYPQIELLAKDFKKNDLFNQWLEKLKKEMYWEIKN